MFSSPWQLLLVAALVVLLFGAGRLSRIMGEAGSGIKAFRKGLKDDKDERLANDKNAETIDAKANATSETKSEA